MISVTTLLLGVSLISNAALAWLLFHPKSKLKTQSYDVRELMRDLSRGGALIKMTRVNPEDVLLRSPRDL